jgi:hypothetical protein
MSTLEILGRSRRTRLLGAGSWCLLGIFLGACSSAGSGDPSDPADPSGAGGTEMGGDTNPGAGGATVGGAGSTAGNASGTAGSVSGAGGSGMGGSGMGGSAMMGSGGSKPTLPPAKGTCGTAMPAAKPVVMTCANQPAATPPAATWTNVTGTLAGLKSECGNLTMISAEPCTNRVIAGVAKQGLFSTSDGGKTWTKLGVTGDKILHRATVISYDPEHAGTFYESGIYGWEDPWTMGVFKTVDDGVNFKGYLDLSIVQSHMDSVSVDFSDPARGTMLVGGHEQKQVLFVSLDAGVTFKDIGKQLPATTGFCTNGLVLNNSTQLVGCAASFSGNAGAILRTTDCGATFKQVNAKGVSGQPLWASDGTIYWPAEGGGMLKSTDLGLTWVSAGAAGGRPQELPDGRILATSNDHAVVTKDGGTTWTPIGAALAGRSGFTYSAGSKTLYAWHNDCMGAVLADAVMAAGWDYTTQ